MPRPTQERGLGHTGTAWSSGAGRAGHERDVDRGRRAVADHDRLAGAPHARDRRTTLAEITSQGRKVVIPATRQIAAQLRLGISDEQAEEVFALVQKLRRSAGEIT